MGPPQSFLALLPPLSLLLLLLCAPSVNSAISNTTFDDASSAFTFSGSWTAVSASDPCDFCSSKPDASQTFDGTWHDGNYRTGASETTTGSFTFTGSAVYIYGIDQAKSQPDIAFTLGSVQSTHHYTGTEQFAYNALFFSATDLAADETHTVNWIFNIDQSTGVGVQAALFDYAIVTSGTDDVTPGPDSETTTTTSSQKSSTTTTNTVSSATKPTSTTATSTKGSVSGTSSSSPPSTPTASQSDASTASSALPTPVGAATTPNTTSAPLSNTPTPQSATSEHHSNIGAIVGGLLGALACIGLAILVFLLCRRRGQRQRAHEDAERRAAGLPPAAPGTRRIRAGNYVPQPFVDDRLAGAAGDTAGMRMVNGAVTPFNARAMGGVLDLQPVRRNAVSGAVLVTTDLPPAFRDTATSAGAYPAEKTTPDETSASPTQRALARQPSQMSQSETLPEKRVDLGTMAMGDGDRETFFSLIASPTGTTSARERYLEERLATLEAHVAQYLPPPYEQPAEEP